MEQVEVYDDLPPDQAAHVLALNRKHKAEVEKEIPLDTVLPFESAANLLRTLGQHGAAKVEVQVWLTDAIDGPAIETRGYINEVHVQSGGDEGRAVVLISDDWDVALDEQRAEFKLTCEGTVVANTRDGNEVAIDLGLTD